ncbi:MAG: outer membrane beta-barrel protein [Bacteroidia bacterium]
MNRIKSNSGSQAVNSETPNPRGNGGLKIGICMKDKLEVSIGCSYASFNQEFHAQTIYFPKTISQPFLFNSSLGDMAVAPATMLTSFSPLAPVAYFRFQYQYTQTLQLLNIPLSASYQFRRGKFAALVSGGINFQYLLSQHSVLELLKENEIDRLEYDNLDIRKLNVGVCFGLGASYRISDRITVYLQPSGRLNLLPAASHSVVQSSSLFIGLECGVRVGL